jgi:hypothetical protein
VTRKNSTDNAFDDMNLTVRDLRAARQRRSGVNHETYKQLWTQAQQRIRVRDEMGHRHMVFDIPPLVPGRPVFKPSHAARYVAAKLRRGGFRVEETPHSLHVSWDETPVERAARTGSNNRGRPLPKAEADAKREKAKSVRWRPPPGSDGLSLSVNEATRRLERLKAVLALPK